MFDLIFFLVKRRDKTGVLGFYHNVIMVCSTKAKLVNGIYL